jgi:acyl dehydratase
VVLLDEILRVVEEARSDGGAGAAAAAGDAGAAAEAGAGAATATAAAGTSGAAAGVGSDAGRTGAATGWTIATAKFLQPVRPGDTLTVEHEALANGAVRFAIRSGGRAVATGTLVPRLEVTERDHGHQAG